MAILLYIMIMLVIAGMTVPDLVHAAYWSALPPYNVLWPLWSPALSPGSPATPLLTELTKSTLLPVQPGLIWDYRQAQPWPIYNAPAALGSYLLFFDTFYGLNPWPPSTYVDPITGVPIPISLPLGYSVYLPPKIADVGYLIPIANATYLAQFGLPTTPFLSTAAIFGLTPFSALPPAVL